MSDRINTSRGGFPKSVLEQAAAASKIKISSRLPYRLDLRGKNVFSFAHSPEQHCETAFSIATTENGWLLGVHVADVCEFVCENSPLDDEARRRCAVLDDGNYRSEMLPPQLISQLCDLTAPGEKLTFSIILEISREGKLLSIDADESIIGQSRQLIYSELQAFLETADTSSLMYLRPKYNAMKEPIFALYELAAVILRRRINAGGPEWHFQSRIFEKNSKGEVTAYKIATETDLHAVVREIGYFVAEAVGQKMVKEKLPCIFIGQRVLPDEALNYLAEVLGHKCSETDPTVRIRHITEEAKGTPYFDFISLCLNEDLPCAEFSDKPIQNCLCGSDHIVSMFRPATSYSDLLTLRTIKTAISAGGIHNLNINRLKKTVGEFSKAANDAYKFVWDCRRKYARQKALDYVSANINGEFKGYPFKTLENGNISVYLECGLACEVSADAAKDFLLPVAKAATFAIVNLEEDKPIRVKPL